MRSLKLLLGITICLGFTTASLAKTPESAFDQNPWPLSKQGPLKVFILAGQSNMQGHASLRTLEYLIYHPQTASQYEHWKDRMGAWTQRRDVWVWTTDGQRSGNLKPGFGANEMKIGPELGFGWVIGEHLPHQVLLIKTCWGGRSVKRDFLPPGADMPPADQLEKELQNARKRRPDTTLEQIKQRYGQAYRDTLSHTRNVLANLKQIFPPYDPKRGHKLAGLLWFQGWNDMVDGQQRAEKYLNYTRRLALLIKAFRKDLGAPDLPVVIGELGASPRSDFQKAQAAVADLPEFKGNVLFVKTRDFWESDLEQMAKNNLWRTPQWPKFYNLGSDRGYHYLGSARIQYRMGRAFAEAMIQLLDK